MAVNSVVTFASVLTGGCAIIVVTDTVRKSHYAGALVVVGCAHVSNSRTAITENTFTMEFIDGYIRIGCGVRACAPVLARRRQALINVVEAIFSLPSWAARAVVLIYARNYGSRQQDVVGRPTRCAIEARVDVTFVNVNIARSVVLDCA
jgi:hypothetical protein